MDGPAEVLGDQPGQPRSEADAAFLERYEPRMRLPIIAAAVLPLIVVPEAGNWVGEVVGVVTWLVFLVDFIVHSRRLTHYGRTGLGRFDFAVVAVTAPWFLLPGASAGSFVVILRLARVARLFIASRRSRRLVERLGRVAALAGGVVLVSSLVAYYAEHPTNSEYATVGDALWWGVVTFTTVGYGDIVPKTPTGRWAGVAIMITGIAVLGVLAGSLSSFFRVDRGSDSAGTENMAESHQPAGGQSRGDDIGRLVTEVVALRNQVAELAARLTETRDGPNQG